MEEPIEGHFVMLLDGSIWEVKGFMHPQDHLIAYPRYVPCGKGYVKVSSLTMKCNLLDSTYKRFMKYSSVYDMVLPHIPKKSIVKVYDPKTRLLEVFREPKDPLEQAASKMLHMMLDMYNVDLELLGITGSMLPKLHTLRSVSYTHLTLPTN